MAAYNTSSAYDLSVYEAQPKAQKRPRLEVVEKRSAKRTLSAAFTPRVLGSFSIVVTLLCLMVYNQVCLNEVTGQISGLQDDLRELQSEHTKISSELESMVSLRTVAERAKNELGMDRLDKYQTDYVYLYEGDKIVRTEHSPQASTLEGPAPAVHTIIDMLKEYISAS